ncbi:hypothetical protein GCM10011328_07000 [Hafnia psychrotolerans]|uniref:Uncharacterized protein n=1 Tax=Hafnia psychrotolerans TaxID=1477018 RepID=A0ABQ1G3L8_9GAMM|nr:hypothetical protein GCM10011328_07000 [Hafnia psychrotolerans]
MQKLINEVSEAMIGKQILGKLTFLRRFALVINNVCNELIVSAKKLHVNNPEQRYIL